MPEARDRLARPVDDTMFIRHRRPIGGTEIRADEPEVNTSTPFRWGATPMTGTIVVPPTLGGVGRATFGNGRGRGFHRSPTVFDRQNTPPGSIRRSHGGRRSVLPSWYQRKPLRDITPIVQAIERRRARLREVEGLQLMSPLPQGQSVHIPCVPESDAPLEHDHSLISPSPTMGTRHCPPTVGKVPKILLDITNQSAGEPDFLTPQKKLLNSIDKVEKVVMDELHRLKRTPTAKKAEREKKVRALMSMR